MGKACQCCGGELTGSRCGYCGFVEIIDMDGTGTAAVRGMAETHREKLAAAITDISVLAYSYRWNPATSRLESEKQEVLKLADGAACYPNLCWTPHNFGQLPAGKRLKLELSYRVRGSQKHLSCSVSAVQCEDFWKIGLRIDQNLKLHLLLGTEQKHAGTEAMALELVP